MKDNITSPEQIFNKPIRRTTFLGPIVGKLSKSGGGSGGPTTYTKSVVNNITNHELTITNVVDGSQQTPYTINYGGGSGPGEYLKTASVNGNTLTITKQDDTTIAFTPSATTDYSNLTNKPSINNITLSGNKTATDLSLVSTTEYTTDLARISGYITTLQGNVETISSAYLTNAVVNQAGDTLTITKQDGTTVVFTLSGSGELPIKYEETYDSSKIISGYLTAFANVPNGLYFKLENSTIKCLATIDYRFDGEITNVVVDGNTLKIDRHNQPRISYTPSVSADITSYNYSDTSAHTISGRAESNWWLIIPKASFGSTTNVLNVRTTKATATSTGGNVDLSASVMVSVWKVVDATSLPEAIVIDPNATIGDLMVLLDVRNTSNAQVSVNNVEFTIQTNISSIETGNAKLIGYAVVRLNSTAGTVEVVSSTGSIQVVGYGTDEPTIFLINGFGTIEAQYRLISVECFNTEYKVRLATAFDSTHQQFAVTPDTNEYYNIMIWSHKQ